MFFTDLNSDGYFDITCDDKEGNHYAKLNLGDGKFRDLGKILSNFCKT